MYQMVYALASFQPSCRLIHIRFPLCSAHRDRVDVDDMSSAGCMRSAAVHLDMRAAIKAFTCVKTGRCSVEREYCA